MQDVREEYKYSKISEQLIKVDVALEWNPSEVFEATKKSISHNSDTLK
jgi:hypothetical protein